MNAQNRRGFLGLLGALATAPLVPALPASTTYGYLTPEIVVARGYDNTSVRVYLDGVDVTTPQKPHGAILACDDRAGFIEFIARDWNGNCRRDPADPTKLARERRYGHVQVTMSKAHGA
jgi:hypothetical protein